MKCENCGDEHDGSYGSGRFCSVKCSRGFSTKAKRKEINEKISKKLKGSGHSNIVKNCLECKDEFTIPYNARHQVYCSKKCAGRLKGDWNKAHDNISKEQWSEINKLSYANGKNYVAGGTSKWYKYKDIKVQGTYELRTCKILDIWKTYNIIKDWKYTKDKIQYIGEDGKEHTYLLDFKVFTNEGFFYYIETKGYQTETDILKWKAVREKGNKLEVWFEKDILKNENITNKLPL